MQERGSNAAAMVWGIAQTELIAFITELSLNPVNAGSDLYYSLQTGLFHALSSSSKSTNAGALRQLLVVCVFRHRSEVPEPSVNQQKCSC